MRETPLYATKQELEQAIRVRDLKLGRDKIKSHLIVM